MYFDDLTCYEYGPSEDNAIALNIGWLSVDHAFSKGLPPAEFLDALRQLARSPVNLYRGAHLCEFCPYPPKILTQKGLLILDTPPGTSGNGEIRVTGENGLVYAAPILIIHYVEAHGYLPPKEFIDAVFRACAH